MALKELLTDLSNFKYIDYDNVGTNNSQIEGRHGGTEPNGQPPHSDGHSILDDEVGFGVYPNDTPQSFDVRGYTITGNKILFKGVGNANTSLVNINNSIFVTDKDYKMKTDMLDTKKFPARDNNVIGFDQPFILKDIGDKWGPGGLGAIDIGIVRGGLVTSVARTTADVLRLGKFALTPRGIMFGLKQFGLQLLNPRAETTTWNPLSLGSIAPMVHIDRHLGGLTYGESIDKDGWDSDGFGSILDGYADAVVSSLPSVGLGFTTTRRITNAHLIGMVPSKSGKMALPGIPELKWIDFPVGNIDSLSKNIVGENKYKAKSSVSNKEYTISHGTPIIPVRNPEAGFKSGTLGGRFAGSQFTQMFLNEDGLFPSKALTDAVKDDDVFKGDLYNDKNKYHDKFKSLQGSTSGVKGNQPKFTKFGLDEKGNPTVDFEFAYLDTSRDPRFGINKGDEHFKKENVLLHDLPLVNKQAGGNDGSERQSLGYVYSDTGGLVGNLFGNPTRFGHGKYADKYSTIAGESPLFKVNDNLTIEEGGVPEISYTLSYDNKYSPPGTQGKLDIDHGVWKTTKESETLDNKNAIKETPVATGTGNLLDRYSTLAYGKLNVIGEDPADDTLHGKLNYEKTLRSASELNQSPRSEELASESHPKGEGRRDIFKKIFNNQGNPGKPNTNKIVVNDTKLKGLVKKEGTHYKTDLTDKVNMHPYGDADNNDDFIKFKFYDIVNKKFIIFRASLSGINETLSPEWSSERYIGRPDKVHVYQGVDRSMSFELKIVPTTRQELPILWEKLNYLIGLTYPTWKTLGTGKRMEAPFMNLTIGDMYNSVPGFLNSLSIAVDDNSTWELEDDFQLPKVINVSCEFTHIGRHMLASQGKHYDLNWLKPLNYFKTEILNDEGKGTGEYESGYRLGDRPNNLKNFYDNL